MTDPLSLELLGSLIRTVQADQRTMRGEIAAVRGDIRGVNDRLAEFEARMETRFDQMQSEVHHFLAEAVRILRGGEPPAP